MRGKSNIQLQHRHRWKYWMTGIVIMLGIQYGEADPAHTRKCPVEYASLDFQTSNRQKEDNELLVIPVVVHVVYDDEEQNISDNQVQSQLNAINQDFRRQNGDANLTVSDFQSIAMDAKIEFELANTDPLGEQTNGITRTRTSHGAFANNDLHSAELGGADSWDTNKYLNIWVANLASGIIGYASQPGSEEDYDGIAIHYQNFGTEGTAIAPYHLGRTLTHEAGHWLGLNHLWGDGDCDSDDGIQDTPNQRQSSSGCQLEKTSCGSLDMVQNFMDFSDDECMSLFTAGQVEVMRNSLMTHHLGLYSTKTVLNSPLGYTGSETILLKYHKGVLSINLSRVARKGELTIYDISGQMLLRQWVEDVHQDIDLRLGNEISSHMKVVQYRTNHKLFSAKFI